jgi:DNA (cytosine-5)-methyltransferase 1
MKSSYITVTDQFCGAGGSSSGAVAAGAELRLALNHCPLAIETHNTNFPNADHDCTDIQACDPRRYQSTDILITSPECTNHSLAKGKQRKFQAQLEMFREVQIDPAEERSRATMWDVPRFAEVHNYRIIIVENVVDVRMWRLFDAWWHAMRLLDYDYQFVYLNSMFAHPTPQSRDRMYIVFWKKGNKKPDLKITPLSFCNRCQRDVEAVQIWKNGRTWGKYKRQYLYGCPTCAAEVKPYYYAAYNAIDWSLPIERIGDRKRPLKDKTLERIKAGLSKFGNEAYLVGIYGPKGQRRPISLVNPFPTLTGTPTFGVSVPPIVPFIIDMGHTHAAHNGKTHSVFDPTPTQTTRATQPLIVAFRGQKPGADSSSIFSPLPTMKTQGLPYLVSYYGNGGVQAITEAMGTVTTHDRHGLVVPGLNAEDCGFRMLQPHEVGRAMAFPDDYVVIGNQREKIKQYGNAVTPPVMKLLMERCMRTFE